MAFLLNLRKRLPRGDGGMALPLVLGIGLVLTVLVATSLTVATTANQKSGVDEDWNAAGAAAYAGVADYQSRLVNDNTYQKYGNPAAPFSQTSSSLLTLPTGSLENHAFGIGISGSWAAVSGSSLATYRYEVDSSEYSSSGVLRLRSTGRVGDQTRSVIANLRQKGFIDFLYFTMYETQDPAIAGTSQEQCTRYYPTRRDSDCGGAIQFASTETVNGPLHSNDALYICGGTFNGKVTSSYKVAPYFRDCGSPDFKAGVPEYAKALDMPPTNTQLRNETRADLTDSEVPRPGCLYTGPTTIKFHGNGTMTVRSPWTQFVNTRENPTRGVANGLCGTPGNGANGLGSTNGATIPVLVQNLVYVQTVPNVVGNPNSWALNAKPPGFACSTNGNGLGYPVNETRQRETIIKAPRGTAYYDCRAGDVFVEGQVDGQMTIAAENYVWITDDLIYKDRQAHVLGLIGQNAVWIWNPIGDKRTCDTCSWSTGRNLLSDTERNIDAAILSVQHTFQAQNHDRGGARGSLNVWGAIAQKYRGTVNTGNGTTGYLKKYSYDPRFRTIAPPKFLSPVSTTYGVSEFAEVAAGFDSRGNAIP